jgi:hypothetical protein
MEPYTGPKYLLADSSYLSCSLRSAREHNTTQQTAAANDKIRMGFDLIVQPGKQSVTSHQSIDVNLEALPYFNAVIQETFSVC